MPLIRGRWFSSAENGQRLVDSAFFSLEMLTTQGCDLSTASTTAVRRLPVTEPALAAPGAGVSTMAATLKLSAIDPRNPSPRRNKNKGIGTVVIPTALKPRLIPSRSDLEAEAPEQNPATSSRDATPDLALDRSPLLATLSLVVPISPSLPALRNYP
jgi:hypothetical protein